MFYIYLRGVTMEKKQLNFNAPLISVRRMSSIVSQPEEIIRKTIGKTLPNRQHSLPAPKTKNDLTKPAAVPFVWEHTPGQRRSGIERKTYAYEEPCSTTPMLPPGRTTRDSVRFYSGERPRGKNLYEYHGESLPWNDHAALLETLVDSMYYSKGESELEFREHSRSDSDSYGLRSPSESLSLSCSMSGLSGYQGPDVKPSGTFSVDLQTREFMINRFLPAAKAVALENPQYVPKKEELLVNEELKVSPIERKPPHNMPPCYSDCTDDDDSESEDEKVTITPTAKKQKQWGRSLKIFPWLCVKKSLCLLNRLPGIKTTNQTPAHAPPRPPTDMKRLARNAYSGPLNVGRKAYSGPLDKQVCDAMYNKRQFHSGALSGELYKCSGDDRRMSYSRDSHGLSPNRHSRSGTISPYRNVTPRSPFNEGTKFLGVPKEEAKRASSYLQDASRKSIVMTTSDKKTVYVDSVQKVEVPSSIVAAVSLQSKSKLIGNVTKGKKDDHLMRDDDDAKCEVTTTTTTPDSPLPPPLPKMPSESWLWRRTSPAIPLQNVKNQRSKSSNKAAPSKWESIVKSSFLHRDHARYSEELIPPTARQQSKRV
ncbi:unnamed protein product [Cuscuta epithymum]|uniref:Uncharacterized protein n=1 Tax=Cuscuta epithymum TaxID=186058 RepID=A0AAV0G1Y5_9ASTE|nr:unnamed protein product [Cuscuta epithymum]